MAADAAKGAAGAAADGAQMAAGAALQGAEAAAPIVGDVASSAANAAGGAVNEASNAMGCFPSHAIVQERCRGHVRMSDVRIGDQIAVGGGRYSRVIAMLHRNPGAIAQYVCMMHIGGRLAASDDHLVLARRADPADKQLAGAYRAHGDAVTLALNCRSWSWMPAQDVSEGDDLLDLNGHPLRVESVRRVQQRGAFAPLTAESTLVVDGALCSCFAPPAAWSVPHSACHTIMWPLRLLDDLRSTAEYWSCAGVGEEPMMTVDALWLLPLHGDKTLHPYTLGILNVVELLQAAVATWCTLLKERRLQFGGDVQGKAPPMTRAPELGARLPWEGCDQKA